MTTAIIIAIILDGLDCLDTVLFHICVVGVGLTILALVEAFARVIEWLFDREEAAEDAACFDRDNDGAPEWVREFAAAKAREAVELQKGHL